MKKIIFYKIVNSQNGHHGFHYKLGVNTDPSPKPLSEVGSCRPGALYFTNAQHLHKWFGYGDKIAYLTVKKYVVDTEGDKYKAKK